MSSVDSFKARATLAVGDAAYEIYRLDAVQGEGLDAASLPYSLKILLENLLRTEDGANITAADIEALAGWDATADPSKEIQFTLARVIMQDFTGVPAVVDLATMREAMKDLGGDPAKINPLAPAELVIDHSVIADVFGTASAFERNVEIEYQRNKERYQFLRWGQGAFDDFRSCHPARASCTRSTSSTSRGSCSRARRMGPPSRIPTRVSAPTPTPRWSTVSASWAGVSAASRPRRRCSVSRCRCSSHVWWASSCQASCPRARPRPTWCSPSPRCCASTESSASSVEFYGPASPPYRSPTAPRSAT